MRAGALILVVVLLASCGKKSAPTAPGPREEVTYPRQYPSR